ncbi:CaiB/BaiF CoA transferase family protein [Variovorax ginsengisoli]|uniref:CoA transferase n=1 Tax=Variovorax ginsengisoli TaxID=363844 RepID=A0ABT8SG96_9BURK|nr:CoA transferase [Variovorax ginsengisoli]MDN8618194.1 CoA transferase [Variovorax ginsengisoli]MDO1537364.1 CoA transferase [Variovorax ginsengisoli]
MSDAPAPGPLAGLRVIDLTINVLGPVCTQILGDMGADVIKVEMPGGDQNRYNGPTRHEGMSVFFLIMNRNKRSIVLDLKSADGQAALMKLVETADVFVHSLRPAAAERLGIGYETIRARNPRIVFACAPGYRSDGPRRDAPAFDDIIQGASGLASMNCDEDGQPRYFPTVIADKFCGYVLASSISMALLHRERSGQGQRVEVPMYETMLQFSLFEHLWEGALGEPGTRLGYSRMFSPHRRPYPTRDGHLCVLAVNDAQWKRLLDAVELSHLTQEARFADMASRMRHIDELYGILAERLRHKTTAQWTGIFTARDVSFGPVNSLDDLMQDEYLRETGFFKRYQHPTEGEVVMTSIPVNFSASPGSYRLPPPRVGEHTQEILESIGFKEGQQRHE